MLSGHQQLYCKYDLALIWDNDWFEHLCATCFFSLTFSIYLKKKKKIQPCEKAGELSAVLHPTDRNPARTCCARGLITATLTRGSVLLDASLLPKSDGVELQSAAIRCRAGCSF